MEIKPVKNAASPQYPVREEVSSDQIKACVPQRWADSRAAKVALGTLAAMTLAGCTPQVAAGGPLAPETVTEVTASQCAVLEALETAVVDGAPMGKTMLYFLSIAPLFLHGEGMGAFGCDMVTPPAFLSEDEALSVINTVAKEYGLKFASANSPVLNNVLQPVTNIYAPEIKADSDTFMTMTTEFADAEHGVALEFVSVEDVKSWHKEAGIATSVESYATQDAAEQLSEALESAVPENFESCTVGVLYDPCETTEVKNGEDPRAAEAQSRDESKAQLAAQVKDFLEWLKAEGVI